ncbi:Hint domain-containing protein [Defluviimonas sp. SAOS-178_SWC]|uniref:Hint domain-containing protein n=1 Tax=Defluviimonas sp. SAOS-178_SWC TaxID=3121287 RepID=UPI0032219770
MPDRTEMLPAHAAHAYPARALRVASGANLGDPIADAGLVEPGDVYRLDREAPSLRLMLAPVAGDRQAQTLAEGSEIGQPGDRVGLLSLLTLMAPDGDQVEVLIVRHDASGESLAIPLSPIAPRFDYTLIAASADIGDIRIADIVCVSFASGTMVTLPGGAQRPIEALQPGDKILTRDHGPQEVRWIGKATLRAKGAFAPVVISAGTLGNDTDLVVSPHHRVFIYQRGKKRLGGTAELLVQAKHLVDGDTVTRREGGFVDYYSLVFDRHEIIYAEGIPAESLMVNEATVMLMPADLAEEVKARFPGLSQSQHFGTEVGREILDDAARKALLRGKAGR